MKAALIDELRTLLGANTFRIFCQKFGGRRVFVPKAAGANHPLTEALGVDAARVMCREFNGLTFDVPMSQHLRALIERDLRDGHKTGVIAQRYFRTRRSIRYIRATLDQLPPIDPKQGSLF